jgi:hypothetical protein
LVSSEQNFGQGLSVALSADGNTAVVGGGGVFEDPTGGTWVYTRSGGVWTQQSKLVVAGLNDNGALIGAAVALSADGNTAIVGLPLYSNTGAAAVFIRRGNIWTQQGPILVNTVGRGSQGTSVALSGDGNTAIVGSPLDLPGGAAWVYTRTNGIWIQPGTRLTSLTGSEGQSVALSADGNTAITGAPFDSSEIGAARVYTRNGGVWSQPTKLVGTGMWQPRGPADQGFSVALSADGNVALSGGPRNDPFGSTWVFVRNGGIWTQQGSPLVGTAASEFAWQGFSVALSGDGRTAVVGGKYDNDGLGAAWVFVQPTLQVTPATNIAASGPLGGPYFPTSFQYQLSASAGSLNYAITGIPPWLNANITSGTATTTPTTVTFSLNNVGRPAPGGRTATIAFTNTSNGTGNTSRTATLTITTLPRLNAAP